MTQTPEVTIRDYRPASDLDRLVALVRELQAHEAGLYDRMRPPGDMGAWYANHIEQECRDHGGRLLVAELDGNLVGYASVLTRIDEDAIDEVAHRYAQVGDLAVSRAARGKGLGRRLLEACQAEARRRGAPNLRITVLAGNTRALDIYHDFGFRDLFINLEKPL